MSKQNQYTSGAYLEKNPSWHVEDSAWKAAKIISLLKRHKLEPQSMAEVGCGAGLVIKGVAEALPGLEKACGFDISAAAIEKANEVRSERVAFIQQDILATSEVFDLVLAIDVVEHIEDYLGFLRGLKAKGQQFVFHFPLELNALAVIRNRQIVSRQEVGHLHYFSKETTLHTLSDCGYVIKDWTYTRSALELNSGHRGLPTTLANFARRGMDKINRDLSSNLLGGYSLLVLAEG